ncbi:MAG TPA: hypothetical protein DCX92_00735 [Bacteroidetes bacterium]|nr:hypothetical protein [Bacteroidota bacterium]
MPDLFLSSPTKNAHVTPTGFWFYGNAKATNMTPLTGLKAQKAPKGRKISALGKAHRNGKAIFKQALHAEGLALTVVVAL